MPRAPRSLNCTVRVVWNRYRYRGVEVKYEVYVSPDETYRQVIGIGSNSASRMVIGPESKTVRLKPHLLHRLRERLTSWEFEPLPEHEHVHEVVGRIEREIERQRDVQDAHGSSFHEVEHGTE